MHRVLEVWGEKREDKDRLEMGSEVDKVLRRSDAWIKKELEEWTVESEVREKEERERERVEKERTSREGEGEWGWGTDQEGVRGDFGEARDQGAGEREGEEGIGGAAGENGRSEGPGKTRKARTGQGEGIRQRQGKEESGDR